MTRLEDAIDAAATRIIRHAAACPRAEIDQLISGLVDESGYADMLAALKRVAPPEFADAWVPYPDWVMCRAAIAKAEGRE
jgi:hypothetical protein